MKTVYTSLLLVLALGFTAQSSAQVKSRHSFNPALSAILLEDHSFLGINLGLTRIYSVETLPVDFGYSFTTGLLHDRIHEGQNREIDMQLFSGSLNLRYYEEVEGNLFWLPLEASLLVGHQENFLEVGAGFHWLQLQGTRYLELADTRYIYRTHVMSFLCSLNLGYRYQPSDQGTFFGVYYKPSWNLENSVHENAYQVSLGYSF